MFWNGTRWVDPRAVKPAAPRHKAADWIFVGMTMLLVVVLVVPFHSVSAGRTAGTPLPSSVADVMASSIGNTVYEETDPRLTYQGSWRPWTDGDFSGGKAAASGATGASVALTFEGLGIDWIGPVGPRRGRAQVFVDDKLVKTVDVRAERTTKTAVVFSMDFSTAQRRTIRIVVLGTRGGRTVAVDTLVVREASPDGKLEVTPVAPPTAGPTAPPVAPPPPTLEPTPGIDPTLEPTPRPTPRPDPTLEPTPRATPRPDPTPEPTPRATPRPDPTPQPTPRPTPRPDPTPGPGSDSAVRVKSIPALLSAVADNSVTEVVVENGTYQVSSAGAQRSNSLWIGSRFAGRTNPILVRAETPGGVTFDGGGATYFVGIWFAEGAHHQTWDGFTFADGTPTMTGVVFFGERGAAPHHITMRRVTIPRSITSQSQKPHDHAFYFSSGAHHLTIEDFTVDGRGGLDAAFHFFHVPGATDVLIRRGRIIGTEQAILLGEGSNARITVEDVRIEGATKYAVAYWAGTSVKFRRVVSTGSGLVGFRWESGANRANVAFVDSEFK